VLLALGFQATLETALSSELSDYRIRHFATHGLLDKESPDLNEVASGHGCFTA
jgi:CHAT domain-containing protein